MSDYGFCDFGRNTQVEPDRHMSSECKLCGRAISSESDDEFCCHGCRSITRILQNLDLPDDERQLRMASLLEVIFPKHVSPGVDDTGTAEKPAPLEVRDVFWRVSGMVCPACAWLLHHAVSSLKGVISVNVNFITEICEITYDPMVVGAERLKASASDIGYRFFERSDSKVFTNYSGFGAGWFFALNSMMLSFVVYSAESWSIPPAMRYLCSILLLAFTLLTVFLGGWATLCKGFSQLIYCRFRMESLVFLSTSAAMAYSLYSLMLGDFPNLYFDIVCLLIMLVETGNLIVTGFYARLRGRVEELNSFLPKKVRLAHSDQEVFSTIESLAAGDTFQVRKGEIVPTDALLIEGAEFDFSLINGESREVFLQPGQFVGAGSKLLSAECVMTIPAAGRSSLLGSIIECTVSAFNTHRGGVSTGDRISAIFVPAVFLLAVGGAVAQAVISGPQASFLCFMRVLIVACPCAFGIAEPLVLMTAIDRLKRIGIQVVNGNVLRHSIDSVIFDKTGTLTFAKPEIKQIYWLREESQRELDILASLENGLEHPIARILSTLGRGIPVTERHVLLNRVEGKIDGTFYQCGQISIFEDLEIPESILNDSVSLVAFGDRDTCYMILSISDTMRPEAYEVVQELKMAGKEVVICSGDREPVVAHFADQLGVDDYHSEMSPSEKKELVTALQSEGKKVMMVGDGINDAQSLAASDFGISVFSGHVPARMSSDAVLLTKDLHVLNSLLVQLKLIRRRINTNYLWAFAYNIAGIALALSGWLSPAFCAIGMVFSNLIVVSNSLRKY